MYAHASPWPESPSLNKIFIVIAPHVHWHCNAVSYFYAKFHNDYCTTLYCGIGRCTQLLRVITSRVCCYESFHFSFQYLDQRLKIYHLLLVCGGHISNDIYPTVRKRTKRQIIAKMSHVQNVCTRYPESRRVDTVALPCLCPLSPDMRKPL